MSTIDIPATFDFLYDDRSVPMQGALVWTSTDPLAVKVIPSRRNGTVWNIARDLLAAGLHDPAGAGDVRVAPHRAQPHLVRIDLRSPDGQASLAVGRELLAEFLQRTYFQVSVDEERDIAFAALDLALAQLFREVQP